MILDTYKVSKKHWLSLEKYTSFSSFNVMFKIRVYDTNPFSAETKYVNDIDITSKRYYLKEIGIFYNNKEAYIFFKNYKLIFNRLSKIEIIKNI